ncbi:TPA: addiction module toxin RelE [Candidatus Uhrbacteria bacterium]|nr:addiction module toxin RelE [Candidatus Uhrbacteria bacterium]
MVRPLRLQYAGAFYHITVRGNRRQDIYVDDVDREHFVSILSDVAYSRNVICYAYCLMSNHYHLEIETPDGNLSAFMRDLNGIVSQDYNKRHGKTGHLFQGRYHSYLIEKETYLMEVARYVVLNPVRAGLVKQPEQWRWSSYRATLGQVESPSFLATYALLKFFHNRRPQAQKNYQKFVSEGINVPSPFIEIEQGIILGSPQFVHEVWNSNDITDEIKELPREDRIVGRPMLGDLFDKNMTKEARDQTIVIAHIRCGYLLSEIARHLGLDQSTVGKISKARRIPNSRPDPILK